MNATYSQDGVAAMVDVWMPAHPFCFYFFVTVRGETAPLLMLSGRDPHGPQIVARPNAE